MTKYIKQQLCGKGMKRALAGILILAMLVTGAQWNVRSASAGSSSFVFAINTSDYTDITSDPIAVSADGDYTWTVPASAMGSGLAGLNNLGFVKTDTSSPLTLEVKSIIVNGTEFTVKALVDITSESANGLYNIWNCDQGVLFSSGDADLYHDDDKNSGTIVFRQDDEEEIITSLTYVFTVTGAETATPAPSSGASQEGCTAFLMFSDKNGQWCNWDVKGSVNGDGDVCGFGNDTVITGNGTYTVSLQKEGFTTAPAAAADGALVFCVDMIGLTTTTAFNADNISVKDIIVKCDGKQIATDDSKIYVGDLENNGNLRLEIRNAYGYGGGDFLTSAAFDALNPTFGFSESLSVTFTLEGITQGTTSYDAFHSGGHAIVRTASGMTTAASAAPGTSTVPGTSAIPWISATPGTSTAPKTSSTPALPATSASVDADKAVTNLRATKTYIKKSGYRYQKTVKLNWKNAGNADGFEIYRKEGVSGKESRIAFLKDGETTGYRDTHVKTGASYTYRVCPVYQQAQTGEYIKGTGSATVTTAISRALKKPRIAVRTSGKKVKVSFRQIEGSGYQTQYRWANKRKWEKLKVMNGKIKKSVVRNLDSKGFYIRVRSYTKAGGKRVYSAWSASAKVK